MAPLSLHLGLNMVLGLIRLPFVGLAAKLTEAVLSDAATAVDPLAALRYLSDAATTPATALANATLETGRMSEVLGAHVCDGA
ncbi:MAG: hypothetical protein U1E15_12275 [Hyphomicrobiales bacterium]